MKRVFLIVCLVCALILLVSCGKTEEYQPSFQLGDGFSYENGVITGTVYTLDTLHLRELVETEDDLLLTADFSADYYSEDGEIPLKAGENSMVLTFINGESERKIPVEITVILLKNLRVEVLDAEKTYRVGEAFDKATVAVIGTTTDGDEVEITDYAPEYEFSSIGKSRVAIELGGLYESFTVSVTEEYRPTLDASHTADGVSYVIRNGAAMLEFAEGAEGFFAVPAAVIADGEEIPVTEIGQAAFEGTAITGVQIPEGVLRVADSAFSDCTALTWVAFPDSLQSIGKLAFLGCESLTSVDIPDGVTEIMTGTFRGCTSLFRAAFPAQLAAIGKDAFFGCGSLVSVEFPVSLRVIGESAFEGCSKLSAAVVGSLFSLGARAFAVCEALSVFAIGDADTVGFAVFDGSAPAVYTAEGGAFSTYAVENGLSVTHVTNEPYVIELPRKFAMEDGFPYASLLAVYLDGGEMRRLKNYEVVCAADACGYLDAKLIAENYELDFRVFVSYTEEVAMDTDSRGAVYALDPATMTTTLISVPQYVRRSDVYTPENKTLFIVPTHLSRIDGVYTVTEIAEGAFDECLNMTEFFVPIVSE